MGLFGMVDEKNGFLGKVDGFNYEMSEVYLFSDSAQLGFIAQLEGSDRAILCRPFYSFYFQKGFLIIACYFCRKMIMVSIL